MNCPTCDRNMTLLFTSAVCEWCEAGGKEPVFRQFSCARGLSIWCDDRAELVRTMEEHARQIAPGNIGYIALTERALAYHTTGPGNLCVHATCTLKFSKLHRELVHSYHAVSVVYYDTDLILED